MCGIVGAISSRPIDSSLLDRMRDDLAHRGPDHSASWLSSDGRVGLGHRRLAIIDLLPEANQPFASHDGRFLLVYNGELYNYRELKKELETARRPVPDRERLRSAAGGLSPLGRGRAAAIFRDVRLRHLGPGRAKPVLRPGSRGREAVLLGDSPGRLSLRLGAQGVPALAHVSRRIHYPALLDFLAYGFVPDPKCIWEHCGKLSPGHCMVVRTGTDGTRRFWSRGPGGIGALTRSRTSETGVAECGIRSPARPGR